MAETRKLVVRNAVIVTCDREETVIDDGAMVVEGRDITWVGATADLPDDMAAGADREIDATGRILMPGLINMHAHCGDSLFRGLVEDLPLEEWLQTVWKAEAAILGNPDDCRLGTALGFAELLLGGVTTVMDMFWHADQSFAAAQEIGIRLASGAIFFDPPGMDGFGPEQRRPQAEALFDRYGEDDELFVGTMPHGTYTVAPKGIHEALDLARERGGFFCTHAAETRAEQETIRKQYATSVIGHLSAMGALSPRTVLAHCVHVDCDEMELLARTGTHVVHNPMSNLKLASGIAPVPEMLMRGVSLCLGTDGPISGNDMDMWLAMRLAATLHKGVREDATAMPVGEVLQMATINGARALAAESWLGSITPGKRADFILLDITGPHAAPIFDPINHVVFAAGRGDVRDVFVSGRQVVRDRQLLTMDVDKLVAGVRALQPRIRAALEDGA